MICITGSSGKTSLKEWTGKILSEKVNTYVNPGNYNNEVGMPLSLVNMPIDTKVCILELGMCTLALGSWSLEGSSQTVHAVFPFPPFPPCPPLCSRAEFDNCSEQLETNPRFFTQHPGHTRTRTLGAGVWVLSSFEAFRGFEGLRGSFLFDLHGSNGPSFPLFSLALSIPAISSLSTFHLSIARYL